MLNRVQSKLSTVFPCKNVTQFKEFIDGQRIYSSRFHSFGFSSKQFVKWISSFRDKVIIVFHVIPHLYQIAFELVYVCVRVCVCPKSLSIYFDHLFRFSNETINRYNLRLILLLYTMWLRKYHHTHYRFVEWHGFICMVCFYILGHRSRRYVSTS